MKNYPWCSSIQNLKIIPFLILISLVGCEGEKKPICQGKINGKCFSMKQFDQNLKSNLSKTTLGFSYAIYYENSLEKWGQNGQARRAQDGGEYNIHAINTDMNVASCAKSISCIATLQLLDKHNISLDTPIIEFLPNWWKVGPNIRLITFRDLLTQRSGFRKAAEDYVEIKDVIGNGIQAADHGEYQYQNLNFCILRILVPVLNGDFNFAKRVDNATADAATIKAFKAYIQTNIFDALQIDFSCNNEHDVLYYSYGKPDDKGWNPGDECHNSGGGTLSMSANDLAKVMSHTYFTNNLLSSKMRELMFEGTDPLGCYTIEVTPTNWGTHFWHNGGFSDGIDRGAAACWYIFPNKTVVAVSTNSFGGMTQTAEFMNINDLIEKSYDTAWK